MLPKLWLRRHIGEKSQLMRCVLLLQAPPPPEEEAAGPVVRERWVLLGAAAPCMVGRAWGEALGSWGDMPRAEADGGLRCLALAGE